MKNKLMLGQFHQLKESYKITTHLKPIENLVEKNINDNSYNN